MEVLGWWHHYRWYLIPICAFVIALLKFIATWKEKINLRKSTTKHLNLAENDPRVKYFPSIVHDTKGIESRVKLRNAALNEVTKKPYTPQKINRSSEKLKVKSKSNVHTARYVIKPIIFYFSLTGTTKNFANDVATKVGELTKLNAKGFIHCITRPDVYDLAEIEYDDFFIKSAGTDGKIRYLYLLLIPTYDIDTMMNTYLQYLEETHHDFRIDTAPLRSLLGYSVFGFGDEEFWPSKKGVFCTQAVSVDKWLSKLTGHKRAFPLGLGDVKNDAKDRLNEWVVGVCDVLQDLLAGRDEQNIIGTYSDSEDSEIEIVEETHGDSSATFSTKVTSNKQKRTLGTGVDDLEDLGSKIVRVSPKELKEGGKGIYALGKDSSAASRPQELDIAKEMVPKGSSTHAALTKQGYSIVGSHSGVKICRWTKSALRGRGSCYKYTFYGIQSHLCMETTPSLSCSNKCVFCWRHGTNPVGTTWRWEVNSPEMIFEGVKAGHYQKIKMMKGVPGIRAERFAEAMRIRHCALSLVGEPIFYPYINEFVDLLHAERISSFLVCNAQHPDHLARLRPVTQLYVSIDASNKDSLQKIDRPLHRDFWERFCRCLDILREKRFRQRTVFRLTLVKGFNIDDEVEGYAELVARGHPCFVEVKGVTYCGTSTSSTAGLTMKNVPFYEEVAEFVVSLDEALRKRGLDYGIAAEHAHSCCALIASKRFQKDGKWCTLIDYDKFFQCLKSDIVFSPEDYMGQPTPEWALWGNGGFNPADERFYRKGPKGPKNG